MPANEVLPGGRSAPLRCRLDAVPAQNVANGLIRYRESEIGQRSHDPVIAPAGVFARQPDHQILDFCGDAWPARRAALLGAVELLGDQFAIPAEDGVGVGDAGNLLQQLPTQAFANFSKRHSLSERDSRSRGGRWAFRMRFSASRYSFFR